MHDEVTGVRRRPKPDVTRRGEPAFRRKDTDTKEIARATIYNTLKDEETT